MIPFLKKSILLLVALFMLSVYTTAVAQPKPWESFNPPPMTVVSPEEEAESNPPLIHWYGHPDAASYRVHLFNDQYDQTWETPISSYTPAESLEKGLYQVQITALDEDGQAVGEPAKVLFRMERDPLGEPIDMNNITFDPGKKLVYTEETIDRLKNDASLERYREIVLEDAAAVPENLKGGLKEPARYPDLVWEFQTWHKNNQYCVQIERAVLSNLTAYVITGDDQFKQTAIDYLNQVSTWDPTGATGVWENDHSAMALMNALAVGYDTLRGELDEADRAAWRAAIAARTADLYGLLNPMVMKETSAGQMNDPFNNHPWFSNSAMGLGALALMGEDERASDWLSTAAQLYWGMFLSKGGRDGGWHEGIDYWSYSLFFVFQFADALKNAADVDLYKHPFLKNTAFFKIYVHPPVGGYVPFGDCKHHAPNAFDKMIMMRFASEYDDPLAWKYVDAIDDPIKDARYSVYSMLWSDRTGADKPLPELPLAKHFEDIGWVVSNNKVFEEEGQILFAMRSGKFFGRNFGHTHADLNSFILTAGGDKLLWDAGYYDSYLSPHHRNYSRLSKAHNTILIDGVGQVVHIAGLDGAITNYKVDGNDLYVTGDASDPFIYGGRHIRFVRDIEFKEHKELVVRDDIFVRELANISFLLHSVFPIVFDPGSKTIQITGEHYELSGTFETDEPVEATLTDVFDPKPTLTSKVLDEDEQYPKQYHLELKTVNKIEQWKPVLRLKLSPIE